MDGKHLKKNPFQFPPDLAEVNTHNIRLNCTKLIGNIFWLGFKIWEFEVWKQPRIIKMSCFSLCFFFTNSVTLIIITGDWKGMPQNISRSKGEVRIHHWRIWKSSKYYRERWERGWRSWATSKNDKTNSEKIKKQVGNDCT